MTISKTVVSIFPKFVITKKLVVNSICIFVLLIAGSDMYSQEKQTVVDSFVGVQINSQPEKARTSTDSQLNFIKWFMGSKVILNQDHNTGSATSAKQILIRSGIVPNRILSRTFMKKAINFESAIG